MGLREGSSQEILKAAPAVIAISWEKLTGIPLSTWSAVATIVYIVAQFIVLVRRELRETRFEEQWFSEGSERTGAVSYTARKVRQYSNWRQRRGKEE